MPNSSVKALAAEPVMVSVVIVSWNAKKYLAQCLGSLTRGVSPLSMEILVVDNASTDGSPDYVEENYPQVRLIQNQSNLGFAKANNLGIRMCRGKYLCLINSDVEVLDDCVATLVAHCEANPDVGMVGPRIIGGDGIFQHSCRGFPSLWNMFCRALALDVFFPRVRLFGGYLLHFRDQDAAGPSPILSGCFWLLRRKALARVGLLDEDFFMYGEDMDWCRRFWSGGWRLEFVPRASAIHYGGASSANAPVRFFIEKQRADLHYWKKHHGWLAQQCYFAIACLHHGLRASRYLVAPGRQDDGAAEAVFKRNRSVQCLKWMLSRPTLLSVIKGTV